MRPDLKRLVDEMLELEADLADLRKDATAVDRVWYSRAIEHIGQARLELVRVDGS